jgi:steroid 5-alpha reductase family enzyme
MTSILLISLAAAAGAFVLLWLISLPLKDSSIVDPFWGASYVLVAWVAWTVADDPGSRQTLLAALVTLWGARLTLYLSIRNLGKGEDYRYQAMRRRWGKRFPLVSLGTVFLLQAGLMWIVSLPVQVAMADPGDPGWLAWIGIALYAVGLFFETVGDWQLARFKADPDNAGKVMDRGLWRYTRHPNYFGDFAVWWGLFLVAVTDTGMLWTIVGPILMSWLLLRVSGVAMLERTIGKRRPGYEEYARRTNAFFPGPPKE